MTAIKKITAKTTTKSPTPAIKSAPVEKPAAKKKVATPAPVIAFSSPAPRVKSVASKPVVTAITAKIDVGFGNALYVRGEGPGLSWNQGVLMTCVGDDVWTIKLGESSIGFTLKFLVNDTTWSIGPDFNVASGKSVTFSPGF